MTGKTTLRENLNQAYGDHSAQQGTHTQKADMTVTKSRNAGKGFAPLPGE
jgi:hypothetical protein